LPTTVPAAMAILRLTPALNQSPVKALTLWLLSQIEQSRHTSDFYKQKILTEILDSKDPAMLTHCSAIINVFKPGSSGYIGMENALLLLDERIYEGDPSAIQYLPKIFGAMTNNTHKRSEIIKEVINKRLSKSNIPAILDHVPGLISASQEHIAPLLEEGRKQWRTLCDTVLEPLEGCSDLYKQTVQSAKVKEILLRAPQEERAYICEQYAKYFPADLESSGA